MALLAEIYAKAGQAEEGLRVLAEALGTVRNRGGHFYEAELYRLMREFLRARSPHQAGKAEGCFHHAIALARSQQAKSWELRTAMSLSRPWQAQGKRAEACRLLAPIYGWFTEGLDTADLQEAKALLEDLQESVARRRA